MVHSIIKGRYLNHSRIFVFLCMIILIVTGCESRDSNTPPPVDEQIIFRGPGPNTVIGTIDVSDEPWGVAATPDGSKVYVTNSGSDADEVTIINTLDETVINTSDRSADSSPETIDVGNSPRGIAILPNGRYVYVANYYDDTVSKIHTTTDSIVGLPIVVGNGPTGIAVSPDGNYVYVAISQSGEESGEPDTVSVITTTLPRSVDRTITVGNNPQGVAVTLDGYVYVANGSDNFDAAGNDSVSVIDTTDITGNSDSTIKVGRTPGGIAVSPDEIGGIAVSPDEIYMYVTNWSSESLSVINTNDVSYEGEILLGYEGAKPLGIAITEIAGTVYVYVANETIDAVTVIE
jgi:YVTN family beta-propeller protein